jgi:2-amino-4-hydroxy-6-hydroxymethyldihydropteridine diphosphokinase
MKKPVFLLLGTNLGNRISNLAQALQAIDQRVGKVTKASSVYETSAWGKTDQPAFLNQAVEIATDLDPDVVLKKILTIEEHLGRARKEKWGERTIDIDILFYGEEVYERPQLVIPHPQLANRRFTLIPLNEIASGFVHPLFKKTVAELLNTCPDGLSVTRFADAPGLEN